MFFYIIHIYVIFYHTYSNYARYLIKLHKSDPLNALFETDVLKLSNFEGYFFDFVETILQLNIGKVSKPRIASLVYCNILSGKEEKHLTLSAARPSKSACKGFWYTGFHCLGRAPSACASDSAIERSLVAMHLSHHPTDERRIRWYRLGTAAAAAVRLLNVRATPCEATQSASQTGVSRHSP